jgi:excinuclease ABC subunit A
VKNNLKHIDVKIPEGCLTSVTGVSGSGKSTLVFDVLAKGENRDAQTDRVIGIDHFQKMIAVSQMPLSKMKRSNVATYSGVYSHIRDLFGHLEEAKKRGLGPKHFSFNTKGGRCEYCEGLGYVTSTMLFFEDIEVPCPVCHGRQFQEEVLSVLFQGYSIKDVLKLSIADTGVLFQKHRKITSILSLLEEVGLGYLELGQTLTSLSNGEGERLKLAAELLESKESNNLYLIDEPTVGLHPLDVRHFLILLQKLVDKGNTIVVIEHNEQVIRASDFIIDLGPGGGVEGGKVIASGTPEEIRNNPQSLTGSFL